MAADIDTPFTPETEDLTALRPASQSRKVVAGKSLSQFEWNIKRGVAIDLKEIREDRLGLTLRPVTDSLGWGPSGFNELARFERVTEEKHHITLVRYLEIMKYYFELLPAGEIKTHPAGALINDRAIRFTLGEVRRQSPMLYEYLGWMHGLVRTGQLPSDHAAERLLQHLSHRRTGALTRAQH
jgi:hypothetical protein